MTGPYVEAAVDTLRFRTRVAPVVHLKNILPASQRLRMTFSGRPSASTLGHNLSPFNQSEIWITAIAGGTTDADRVFPRGIDVQYQVLAIGKLIVLTVVLETTNPD